MYGNSEGGHTRNIYLRQINNFIAFLGFPPESQFEKVPWSGPSSAYGGLSSVLKFLRLLSRSTLWWETTGLFGQETDKNLWAIVHSPIAQIKKSWQQTDLYLGSPSDSDPF
jgi:hypothetical protein